MSFGKLLASGRSLAGGPSMGRYNVSERNRLPKFNVEKNPFAPKPVKPAESAIHSAPVSDPAPAVPVAMAQPSLPVETSVVNSPFSAAAMQPAQPVSTMNGTNWVQRALDAKAALLALMKGVPSHAQAVGAKLAGFGNILLALIQRTLGRVRRVRRKEPASVIPRFGKPAVQGELSLDNVKVVCNDLEESDLEIVTAQTDTGAQVAPSVSPAMPNRGPMPAALKKLTNRITGVNVS